MTDGDVDELGQRAGRLDSGRTAADDYDERIAVCVLTVGPLEAGEDRVADPAGVVERVEAECMLGGTGHTEEGGGRSAPHDEVLISKSSSVVEVDGPLGHGRNRRWLLSGGWCGSSTSRRRRRDPPSPPGRAAAGRCGSCAGR